MWVGFRLEMVISRRFLFTGTVWGCFCIFLYWIRKESKGFWVIVYERRIVFEVTVVIVSFFRWGVIGGFVGREVGIE